MNARSNAASQGHYTRRANAGQVPTYEARPVRLTLRNGDVLVGYCWRGGLRYTYAELRTYLVNTPREVWLQEMVLVGATWATAVRVALADVARGGDAG